MSVALSPNLPRDLLARLIVADIAPVRGELSSDFKNYTNTMSKIEHGRFKSRKEADEVLTSTEPVKSSQAYLLYMCTDV